MELNKKTLEKLREIINGDDSNGYRSGPKLVDFFNELGFQDEYRQGFPSRWIYTDEKLQQINGTPTLDKCIHNIFAVINYIERLDELDNLIAGFNKYLAFDKWKIIRDNEKITIKKIEKIIVQGTQDNIDEKDFLALTFDVNINLLALNTEITDIIKRRLKEAESCISHGAPLAAIFLIGSILEGILLGIASSNPQLFNQAKCAPKEKPSNKVRKFYDWTLNDFIDVAFEIGILKQDVKKFSIVVRDFRNYIHPYQQMASHFSPDKQTAMICFQVMKAVLFQIDTYNKENIGNK